jgi:hypothetical protein
MTRFTEIDVELYAIKDRMMVLMQEMNVIKTQLQEARIKCATTKDYSDSKWYAAANTAHRCKGIELQKLQGQLAALKRERHLLHNDTFENKFLEVARDFLPKETYMFIAKEASRKIKEMGDA